MQGDLQGVSFARGLVQMHECVGVGSIERIAMQEVESWRESHGANRVVLGTTGVSFPCPGDSLGTLLPAVDRAAGYPQNGHGSSKPAPPFFVRSSGLRCLEGHT
ncbi:hypothetical protein DB32_007179 [Sandaracinus amylolyticus]|uniref:Uncharacterized protein n=1 Tax=Sandaracinus amylolyticus TaxID=927083 RepID=A0A0F6W8E2_9BACT|nr:hypothetical protein DB32_007179 [Sandaracinus amylolyticus]